MVNDEVRRLTQREIADKALALRRAYTVPETGSIFNCGKSTVYAMIKRGEIDAIKIGRSTRISASSIDRRLSEASAL